MSFRRPQYDNFSRKGRVIDSAHVRQIGKDIELINTHQEQIERLRGKSEFEQVLENIQNRPLSKIFLEGKRESGLGNATKQSHTSPTQLRDLNSLQTHATTRNTTTMTQRRSPPNKLNEIELVHHVKNFLQEMDHIQKNILSDEQPLQRINSSRLRLPQIQESSVMSRKRHKKNNNVSAIVTSPKNMRSVSMQQQAVGMNDIQNFSADSVLEKPLKKRLSIQPRQEAAKRFYTHTSTQQDTEEDDQQDVAYDSLVGKHTIISRKYFERLVTDHVQNKHPYIKAYLNRKLEARQLQNRFQNEEQLNMRFQKYLPQNASLSQSPRVNNESQRQTLEKCRTLKRDPQEYEQLKQFQKLLKQAGGLQFQSHVFSPKENSIQAFHAEQKLGNDSVQQSSVSFVLQTPNQNEDYNSKAYSVQENQQIASQSQNASILASRRVSRNRLNQLASPNSIINKRLKVDKYCNEVSLLNTIGDLVCDSENLKQDYQTIDRNLCSDVQHLYENYKQRLASVDEESKNLQYEKERKLYEAELQNTVNKQKQLLNVGLLRDMQKHFRQGKSNARNLTGQPLIKTISSAQRILETVRRKMEENRVEQLLNSGLYEKTLRQV